jgi:hypothetical protein
MKPIVTLLCLALPNLTAEPAASSEHVHCNLAALSKAERARDAELILLLRDALSERQELSNGYAYRFDPTVLKELGEWLQIVAKCCQPLTYDMVLAPQPGGALWVRITGKDGAKGFIEVEFAQLTAKLAARGSAR